MGNRSAADLPHYLCGPIVSGRPDHMAFEPEAMLLRDLGLTVRSPHEIKYPGYMKGDWPRDGHVRSAIRRALLMECARVVLIGGWAYNEEARDEVNLALSCQMPISLITAFSKLVDLNTGEEYKPWAEELPLRNTS